MQGASIEHLMPGRVRLRFCARRGDIPFFEDLVRTLSTHRLVNRVKANPLTGSLLVEHSAGPAELAAFAEQTGLPLPPAAARAIARPGRRRRMRRALPRASAASAALAALALYQGTRGRLLGSAGELFWHALRIAGTRNTGVIGLLIGSGLLQTFRGRLLPPASSLLVYALLFEQVLRGSADDRRARRLPRHDATSPPLAPGG